MWRASRKGFANPLLWRSAAIAAFLCGVLPSAHAAEPAADKNYMGIGLVNPGNSTNAPIFTDLMKATGSPTLVGSNTLAPVDANGWPNSDAQYYLIDGAFVKNITGAYRIRFKGQATIGFQFGGMSVSGQSYDSATNTTTANITCTSTTTIILQLTNTRKNSSSGTNTGVADIQLMRPTYPGSTTAYNFTDTFTNQVKTLVGKFHVIRFMDYKATNSNGEVAWSDRVRPLEGGRNAPTDSNGNSLYGWQGKGGAWEYAVQLANETNSDMWINIPAKANNDYIDKVAQLIRYGSDGANPYAASYTGTKKFAGLNSGLKCYVEYSNEVWNYFNGFRQTSDNNDLAQAEVAAGTTPINYDGTTDAWVLARRRVGQQTVNISNRFRAVWGDSNMMTRIRPVLEWQYGNAGGGGSYPLEFINNWYNNADGNHVSSPRPVNYFIWGGGSAAYYNPVDNNSDTLTVDQILNESDPTKRPSQWDYMTTDIALTTMYGIKRAAYEGGLGLGDDPNHSLAAKKLAINDSRLQDVVKNAQNRWSSLGGDLLVYFESSDGVGYGHTNEDFSTSTQKLQAIDSLRTSTKAAPALGVSVPATIAGANWQLTSRGWGSPSSTGSLSAFGTVPDQYGTTPVYWASYMLRVPTSGTYSISVNYSSNASTSMKVWAVGNLLGTASISNTNGGSANTPTYTVSLNAGLNSIRLNTVANAPNFTINSVSVTSSGTPVTLANPGFESGSTSGWLGGGSIYGVNSAAPRSGSYNSFNNGGWNSIFQNVTVQPNSSYTLKVWGRLATATSGNNQYVYVYNNGTYVTAPITSTGYQEYTLNFTTGNNTSVQIGNYEANGSNTVAYTDDYSLTKN